MDSVKLAKYNNSIVIILWGLIFSKCFVLEYLVQIYSIPINSTVYIWSLTLWMAVVATFAFLRVNSGKNSTAMVPRRIIINWISCGIITLLILTGAFLSNSIMIDPYSIPALFSFMLGIGCLIHGFLSSSLLYILRGISWWAGTFILFNQSNINSLPLFAFLILLLIVFPVVLEMKKQKLAFYRADKAHS